MLTIPFFPDSHRSLGGDELDDILGRIDTFSSIQSSSGQEDCPSILLHAFGVFKPVGTRLDRSPSSTGLLTSSEHLSTAENDSGLTSATVVEISSIEENYHPDDPFLSSYYPYFDEDTHGLLSAELHSPYTVAETPSTCERDASSDATIIYNSFSQEATSTGPLIAWTKGLTVGDTPVLRDAVTTPSVNYCWTTAKGDIIRNPTPIYLSNVEHFLMHHYMHQVVQLFCIFDNKKSPWNTIHLPRALQSVGQLNVEGSSTRIRDALRNTLLSISAFYFANDSGLRSCADESATWIKEATYFRCKAIQLLKAALENDIDQRDSPKYKDFLATMLSMISINVSTSS